MSEANLRSDTYSKVTDQIVKAIELGVGNWEMPWHTSDPKMLAPRNAATGKRYRGVNVVGLWASAYSNGFSQAVWATFQQWQGLGCSVRKGERASTGVFWKISDVTNSGEERDENEGTELPRRSALAKFSALFNACQVDGFDCEAPEPIDLVKRNVDAERFFESLGIKLHVGGNIAAYSQLADVIRIPPFEAFRDPVAYYATLAHECTHWTGHECRLNRDLKGRFGDESYAAEELIAELGAAFIAADLQLTTEPRDDMAAYVESRLKILKSDKRAIFTAAAHAQRAADFMHGLLPEPLKPKVNKDPLNTSMLEP